jgi:hypothetical protein
LIALGRGGEGVRQVGVDTPKRHIQHILRRYFQRDVIEGVWRVKINRLRFAGSGAVALTPDIEQAQIVGIEADRIHPGGALIAGQFVGQGFHSGIAVIRIRIGPASAHGAVNNADNARNLDVGRLLGWVLGWIGDIEDFVNPTLMIIGGNEHHIGGAVVCDEFEQIVALSPIATQPRLTAISTRADGTDLVDWIGGVDEFPGGTRIFGFKQGLLQPGELGLAEQGAVRIVCAAARIVGSISLVEPGIAVGAGVELDLYDVLAPLLSAIELDGVNGAAVRHTLDGFSADRLIFEECLLQRFKGRCVVDVISRGIDVVGSIGRTVFAVGTQGVWCAAVDVLLVAEFVVVPGDVEPLGGEEGVKALVVASCGCGNPRGGCDTLMGSRYLRR